DPRPSWAFPPPGPPSSQRGDHFGSPPPPAFIAMTPPRLALGVLPLRGSVCLGAGHRPARGFRPGPFPPFESENRGLARRQLFVPPTRRHRARVVPRKNARKYLILLRLRKRRA